MTSSAESVLGDHFTLIAALVWFPGPALVGRWHRRVQGVPAGEPGALPVYLGAAAMCLAAWALQRWRSIPSTDFFPDWPSPQLELGLAVQWSAALAFAWWVFARRGDVRLAREMGRPFGRPTPPGFVRITAIGVVAAAAVFTAQTVRSTAVGR